MFKFINKYIIAAVCFYIVWLGLFPFLLTKSALILSKNFSANSNYEIILENPKFKLLFKGFLLKILFLKTLVRHF